MLSLNKDNSGETIIEVLIAMTVLAVVLGVSYASASRSLRGSQTAQERTEAQYISQSLLETVKIHAQRNKTVVYPATDSTLCFGTTLADIAAPAPASVPYDPTHPMCNQGMYRKRVAITRLPLTPEGLQQYEYAAIVEWDSLATGLNQTIMRYKHVRIPVAP